MPADTPNTRRRISITSISSLQPRSRPSSPSLSVASSSNSASPAKLKRLSSVRNTLRRIGSGTRGSGRNVVHPLPNEKPIAVLRVRIFACKNLTAADWNGKSDP